MEKSSISYLIKQMNDKWPNRNTEWDVIEDDAFSFHPDLDGSPETIQQFLQELIDLAKNGEDGERIDSISFRQKIASGKQKNKFWVWQSIDDNSNGLATIKFNLENIKKIQKFNAKILSKPKKTKENPNEFPGPGVLQFKKRNKAVRSMQEKLNAAGFPIPEKEMGYYGEQTCEQIKRYYRTVLGVHSGKSAKYGTRIGPAAWERLFS